MKKRVLLTLLLLLCALALCGCGKELTEEEIFTKTIHDFGDLRVDNLDEQEHTNFIVYAEGVEEITTDPEHNIVLSVDEENLCYTFQNPDAALLAMEPGDVFWAACTPENPEGVTVKLKRMEQQGDTLVVYSEEIGLADIFEYVDINMEVPMSELPERLVTLGEGVEVVETPAADSLAANGTASPATTAATGEASAALLGTSSAKVERLDLGGEWTVPFNKTYSVGINIPLGSNGSMTGSASVTIESVWLKFRWSTEHAALYTGASVQWSSNHYLGVTAKGEVKSYDDTHHLVEMDIPGAWGPLFMWTLQVDFVPVARGSISAGTTFTDCQRKGFTMDFSADGVNYAPIDETIRPFDAESKLAKLNGAMGLGLQARIGAKVGLVGNIYGTMSNAYEFSGSYEPLEEEKEDGDFRHECMACIDGRLDFVKSLGVGADISFSLPHLKLELDEAKVNVTLLEIRDKLKDFYISFDEDPTLEEFLLEPLEFGWGECPHKLWKTTVEVEQKNGGKADGASVTATTPDGEKISEVADEDGVAVLYLPNGENSLRGLRKGEKGRTTVEIKDKPAEKELVLDGAREIFVVGGTENIASGIATPGLFPEAEAVLRQRYPDIVVLDADAWYTPESGYLTCLYDNALLEEFGIVPGDILIEVKPWMYYTGLSREVEYREYGEYGEYPQNLYVTVSMALGAKNGRPLMIRAIGMGAGFAFNGFYYYNETPTTIDADYWCNIDREVFPEYDEDFTLIGYPEGESRSIVIDASTELSAPIPAEGILENEPILQRYAEWYLPYIFPYVDMLWEGTWDEDLVPIYPNDAA